MPDTPSYATAELTWGLILAAMRQIPQQMAALQRRRLADGRRPYAARQDARHLRLRPDRRRRGRYGEAFGMNVLVWARESLARTAARAAGSVPASKAGVFRGVRRHFAAHAPGRRDARHRHRGRPRPHEAQRAARQYEPCRVDRARGARRARSRAGRPGMAAVDVFEQEPLRDRDASAADDGQRGCTPHIGYVTRDEYELQFPTSSTRSSPSQRGAPINAVNPEALRGAH